MPAGMKLIGFEGKLYWGAAGSTASTELAIARDVSYKFENVEVDISDRSSIINLFDVGGINFSLEFEVNNKQGHAFIVAMRAAIDDGTAMAFRTRDYSSGYGVDGDFIFSDDETQPLRDAQRLKISCKPTDKNSRLPTWA